MSEIGIQYKEHYLEINSSDLAPVQLQWIGQLVMCKVNALIQELLDDEDDSDDSARPSPIGNLTTLWHKDFNGYLYSKDQLGDMSIVEWWGAYILLVLFKLYDYADYLKVEC